MYNALKCWNACTTSVLQLGYFYDSFFEFVPRSSMIGYDQVFTTPGPGYNSFKGSTHKALHCTWHVVLTGRL